MDHSISFFDEQFRLRHDGAALELNPFESLALPWLRGDVLDFGCGLGNLAFAAAARGCKVEALDGSPTAIEHVRARAAAEQLPVAAAIADLRDHPLERDYDAVVSIGLLMFFDCPTALRVLADLQSHVRPGGVLVVNMLVDGTTYVEMFSPCEFCLLTPEELLRRFDGWTIARVEHAEFDAPQGTVKRFCTVVARKC